MEVDNEEESADTEVETEEIEGCKREREAVSSLAFEQIFFKLKLKTV